MRVGIELAGLGPFEEGVVAGDGHVMAHPLNRPPHDFARIWRGGQSAGGGQEEHSAHRNDIRAGRGRRCSHFTPMKESMRPACSLARRYEWKSAAPHFVQSRAA